MRIFQLYSLNSLLFSMEEEEQPTGQKKKKGLKVKIQKFLSGHAADGKSSVKQEEASEVVDEGKSRIRQEESRELGKLVVEPKPLKRKSDEKKSKAVFSLSNLFGKPSKRQANRKTEVLRKTKRKKKKQISSSESEVSITSSDDGEPSVYMYTIFNTAIRY